MAKADKKVPAMTTKDLATALSKHGIKTYREHTGMALNQAQRNLAGRTEYVTDASLKAHKASVLAVHVMDDGLILAIVERAQKTANPDDGDVFRPVFFDVFGNIIHRPDLNESHDSPKAAMADVWKEAAEIDAVHATIVGAKAKQKAMQKAVDVFTELVEEIEE